MYLRQRMAQVVGRRSSLDTQGSLHSLAVAGGRQSPAAAAEAVAGLQSERKGTTGTWDTALDPR